MTNNTVDRHAECPSTAQPVDHKTTPGANLRPPPVAPVHLDWDAYDRQEDQEPFDAIRAMAGNAPRRDLDPLCQTESSIQAFVRQIKMDSNNYKSNKNKLFNDVGCDIPPEAIKYSKSRLGRCLSPLLRWHYYLFMYFAEKKDWLRQALVLMLEDAARIGNDCRAFSYIMTAHNLNKWYKHSMNNAVLGSVLCFIRERDHNNFTHWCVHIVADLKGDLATRNEMQDTMIRAADSLDHIHAKQCLEAAVHVASDKKQAREACMRLCEDYADGLGDPSLMLHEFFEAHLYAADAEDRRRLAGKIMQAAGSIKFTEYTHEYSVPDHDLQGGTGPERIRSLVSLLESLASAAGASDQLFEERARENYSLFDQRTIGSDGVPGPSPSGRRGSGDAAAAAAAAARTDRLANSIQFLTTYLSALALEYESDGRIAACDHTDVIKSTGLCDGPTETLIEAGIRRHYEQDYISSVHTLLPQVEQTLRLALDKNGIMVVSAADSPKYELLKTMISRGADIVGSDLSAFLLALLVDTDSINLRNRVCHGLHNASARPEGSNLPSDFNHATSLLLILIIELVCSRHSRTPSPDKREGQ